MLKVTKSLIHKYAEFYLKIPSAFQTLDLEPMVRSLKLYVHLTKSFKHENICRIVLMDARRT